MHTKIPDSATRAQKGSNSGKPKERVCPRASGTGAGRTPTQRAPLFITKSSSAIAASMSARLIIGTE